MAVTLGSLKILLNFALGTSEVNLLTTEKRVDALNTAIQNILEQYPIPQYVASTNLNFVAGTASLPTDCVIPLQLNQVGNGFVHWDLVDWSNFSLNIPQSSTIQWDSNLLVELLKIYPADTTTLQFWYIQNQPALVTDADLTRFNPWWAKPIAEKAAEKLFLDSASFNRSEAKAQVADDLIAKAWQTERIRIREAKNNKLTSIYTKQSLIGGRSFPFASNF